MEREKTNKLPAIQFYPADWRKDIGVQSLSFTERAVWFEMLCVMHESEERGKLVINGQPMGHEAIARLIGCEWKMFKKALDAILKTGVASVDDAGAIYNRRMVKDEASIKMRRECGKLGGNPKLCKKDNQISTTEDNQNPSTADKQAGNQKQTPSSSSSFSSSEIIHQQHAQRFFSDEGKNDREKIQIQRLDRAATSPEEVEQFNAHLSIENKPHQDYNHWLSHLRNYLNTKPVKNRAEKKEKPEKSVGNYLEMNAAAKKLITNE